jgi:hypothetical protein
MSQLGFWLSLVGLGAYHGINPGMGWLFAVALGLQEKRRGAVLAALPPIALGHALSVGLVVLLLALAQASLPAKALRIGAAGILFGFGLYRLRRSRHPNWVGMRVGFRDLTLWSFLMASAHGAGLMLLPLLLRGDGISVPVHRHHPHSEETTFQALASLDEPIRLLAAVCVHTAGHLVVATAIALLVFEKLGVAILRHAWFNLDRVWAFALLLSGILILLV